LERFRVSNVTGIEIRRPTMTATTETIFRFNTMGAAMSFTERATKIWMIILGDDELFWVVTPAHAERLVKGGYELAPR
jgi:hypothetical protein